MNIAISTTETGVRLIILGEDSNFDERISSLITRKVGAKTIEQLTTAAIECSRWNDEKDIDFVKFVVENYLTESEIDQLINQLKN